jgi:hypothetical protein
LHEEAVVRDTEITAPADRTKAIPLKLIDILGLRARNILPVMGLTAALIVNAAWVGFLGYFVLKLL